jgi:hypothetical protein
LASNKIKGKTIIVCALKSFIKQGVVLFKKYATKFIPHLDYLHPENIKIECTEDECLSLLEQTERDENKPKNIYLIVGLNIFSDLMGTSLMDFIEMTNNIMLKDTPKENDNVIETVDENPSVLEINTRSSPLPDTAMEENVEVEDNVSVRSLNLEKAESICSQGSYYSEDFSRAEESVIVRQRSMSISSQYSSNSNRSMIDIDDLLNTNTKKESCLSQPKMKTKSKKFLPKKTWNACGRKLAILLIQ